MATTTTKLYVPEGCYLVCDAGMTSRELIVTHQSTVFVKDHNKLAGTELDKMQDNHNCANMVILGAIVGVAIAAIICTAVVLSGGTLAIGLGSALAIGAASGAATGFVAGLTPCICAFLTDDYWINTHPTVRYQGLKPLLEDSELPCWMGGTVRIVYSKEMADAIDRAKRIKTVLTVAVITLSAFTAGKSISSLSKVFAIPTAIGELLTQFGWKGLGQLGINVALRASASYGLGKAYSYGKNKITINGIPIRDYINGVVTNTEGQLDKLIYLYKGDYPDPTKNALFLIKDNNSGIREEDINSLVSPAEFTGDEQKKIIDTIKKQLENSVGDGVSTYSSVIEAEEIKMVKSDSFIGDSNGNVTLPGTYHKEEIKKVLINNQKQGSILGKGNQSSIEITKTERKIPNGKVITTTTYISKHGTQLTPSFLNPLSYIKDIGKNLTKDLLKDIIQDLTLIILHQLTAYMNEGIEKAQPAEDKARQGVKVHENTI